MELAAVDHRFARDSSNRSIGWTRVKTRPDERDSLFPHAKRSLDVLRKYVASKFSIEKAAVIRGETSNHVAEYNLW